jgi:nucleotide-binding universal stress UspA family protein
MYDRILIAVDGSEGARRAARRGLALAAVLDADVDVLTVVERGGLRLAETSEERDQVREQAQAALAEAEELASEFDRAVATTVADGKPAAEIRAHAAAVDADLVVVGRQGVTGLGRRLLGGVADRVLRRSDVPVLVVPGEDDEAPAGLSRVLVTTDGSENAAVAVPHAAEMARRHDATVHVLNVVDLQAAGGPFDAGGLQREFVERLEARGADAVDDAAADVEAAAPGVAVETAVERTKSLDGPAAGIREYVENEDVDLVVMGSHGRSNLRRQLLGSVTSTVLRTVDVPVLVVNRAD